METEGKLWRKGKKQTLKTTLSNTLPILQNLDKLTITVNIFITNITYTITIFIALVRILCENTIIASISVTICVTVHLLCIGGTWAVVLLVT